MILSSLLFQINQGNSFPSFAVIAVAFITALFLTWFFIHRSREQERRLLIENGATISELPDRKLFNFRFPWLKMGVVITSMSVGLITGGVLGETLLDGINVAPVGMFLFGGIGMIIAHYLDRD